MLSKYELEYPINNYSDLQKALAQCTSAKNALSQRNGYSPGMLVFGKAIKVPGSISSDENLPSHLLADEETQQCIQFRQKLAVRKAARRAFHAADNCLALRRAMLRRTRPSRGSYEAGAWVMFWKQTTNQRGWFGPARVLLQGTTSAFGVITWAT